MTDQSPNDQFHASSFLQGHNAEYIDQLQARYATDPASVDAFFDDVMVNAEEMDVRLNRQGLLKCLHVAMNRVADLSRLVS
ncbi:MAG: Glycine--tRNA ligase beta subunit [Pseudomonadota bacterium]